MTDTSDLDNSETKMVIKKNLKLMKDQTTIECLTIIGMTHLNSDAAKIPYTRNKISMIIFFENIDNYFSELHWHN